MLTSELSALKSIEHWMDLQYSFDVAKEAARLGLLDENRYKAAVKAMFDELLDRFNTHENNNSHNEESE